MRANLYLKSEKLSELLRSHGMDQSAFCNCKEGVRWPQSMV